MTDTRGLFWSLLAPNLLAICPCQRFHPEECPPCLVTFPRGCDFQGSYQQQAARPPGLGGGLGPLRAGEGPPPASQTPAAVLPHPRRAHHPEPRLVLGARAGDRGWGSGRAALFLAASMNVALYAGIAGGVAAALIIIGIIVYCCCCRETGKAEDAEVTRP